LCTAPSCEEGNRWTRQLQSTAWYIELHYGRRGAVLAASGVLAANANLSELCEHLADAPTSPFASTLDSSLQLGLSGESPSGINHVDHLQEPRHVSDILLPGQPDHVHSFVMSSCFRRSCLPEDSTSTLVFDHNLALIALGLCEKPAKVFQWPTTRL
jgi:hypothetical protein